MWFLWMVAGAVLMFLGLLLAVLVDEWRSEFTAYQSQANAARRQLVAERQMQIVVQETVGQMFDAVRRQ